MTKLFLVIASLSGALAVVIGAFGAHALKAILEANERAETFELASRYHYYHTFALLAVGILLLRHPQSWFTYSGYCFLFGILIFSGSLYILALSNMRWLGAITPIGGLALILGWVFLLLGVLKVEI